MLGLPLNVQELSALFTAGRLSWEDYEAAMNALTVRQARTAKAPPAAQPKRLELPPPADSPHYARASSALYSDRRMNDTARRLVLQVIQWARGRPYAEAFVDQLADALGRSRRMVQYAQARAQRCGYLRVERVRTGRINDANRYHLLPAAMPAIQKPRRPRKAPGERRRRRRADQAASSAALPRKMGVQNLAPHEEGPTALPPFPPEGGLSGAPRAGAAPVNVPSPPLAPELEAGRGSARGEGARSRPPAQPPP